jgi:hypothetical protein
MSAPSLELSVPPSIVRKLLQVRRHKMLVHATCAVVAALAVLLAAMCVAMLIDWLATLYDSRWRVVLTSAALLAAALTTVGWLVVAWRRSLSIHQVAGDVDRELPQLEQRWTTITRLASDESKSNVVHPAMLRRVAMEAAGWEPQVEPVRVVSLSTLVRTLLGLTAITAVLALALLLDSRQTLVLARRFWAPGSSISATQLVDVPGDIVVGRGEPVALGAKVEGWPVQHATLFLASTADPNRTLNLVAHGGDRPEFVHRLRAVEAPFEYRFRAGDGQTEWFKVNVADRPEIEKLRIVVTPPAYTKHAAETFDHLPRRISAMQKSTLELALRPTMPLKLAELLLGENKRVSLVADGEGWFHWSTTLENAFTMTPTLTETHGLTNRQTSTCDVVVYEDKPPAVKVLAPDDEMVVRPDDTIEITFAATDDVGIRNADLVVYESTPGGETVPVATIPIPLDEAAGTTTVHEKVDLNLSKFAAEDGAELSYEIRVREERGQPMEPAGEPKSRMATDSKLAAAGLSSAERIESPPKLAKSGGHLTAAKAATPKAATKTKQATNADIAPPSNEHVANAAVDGRATPRDGASLSRNTAAPESRPAASSQPEIGDAERPSAPSKGAPATIAKADKPAASGAKAVAKTSPAESKTPDANQVTAKSAVKESQAQSNTNPQANNTPRTATSGRKGIQSENKPSDQQSASQQQASGDQQASAQQQQSAASGQMASSDQKASSPSDQPPSDSMPKRALDVAPQSSASQRMRLKVDKWAGSFSGQQRTKLELAIAPDLEALDEALAAGQRTANGVLEQLAADDAWRASHDREVTSAEKHTVEAQRIIDALEQRSKGTPYAFVGLQVVEIGLAHVEPARNDFWKAIEANDGDRAASVRDALQHLTRARELLNDLRGRFERTRREFQLAESIEQAKKMYQVYVENSLALLQTQDSDPARYHRKMAQFDLDDEYLKRLQEVLEMRAELQAELARILGDDPRLLRRFMDSLRNRSNNLREELAGLVERQNELNREVRAWAAADEVERPQIAQMLLLRHVFRTTPIASAAGKLQERYETWLPLNRDADDAGLLSTTQLIQDTATAAADLNATAQRFIAVAQQGAATPAVADDVKAGTDENSDAVAGEEPDATSPLPAMLANAQQLHDQLGKLDVALRQIAARKDDPESAAFAANRLVDTRRLIADNSAWLRQMKAHEAGTYSAAAEVEQYRLAMKTDELAGKLGSIEQSLAGMLQREDGTLPEPIANKAREFLTTLDREASPNQLAAVYALHSNALPRTAERQQAAGAALEKAEKQYDDLMKLAIAELDKLPVQDPVSALLDDPTLDQLLAQLEQELQLQELLGIPTRPSNLRIIYDWMNPGSNGAAGMGAGGQNMAANQVRQDEQRARDRLNQTYRRAIARALKESEDLPKVEIAKSTELSDWNRLISKLGEDLRQGRDKAPPEQYRRAIEQYFSQISREGSEPDDVKGPSESN